MINLLGADVLVYVSWGLLCFFVVSAVFVYVYLKRKINGNINKKVNVNNLSATGLSLNIPYLQKKEIYFLEVFSSVLPKEYVVLPRIGVDNLVKPFGNLLLYNHIRSKYVDMAVFLKKNMQPVVVIDLVDAGTGDSLIEEQDDGITKALKSVQIPVLSIAVKSEYDKGELLSIFLDVLDPVAIAELKKSK